MAIVLIFLAWAVLGASFYCVSRGPRPIPLGARWHAVPWSWFACSCGAMAELHADADEAEVSVYYEQLESHRSSCEMVSQ